MVSNYTYILIFFLLTGNAWTKNIIFNWLANFPRKNIAYKGRYIKKKHTKKLFLKKMWLVNQEYFLRSIYLIWLLTNKLVPPAFNHWLE